MMWLNCVSKSSPWLWDAGQSNCKIRKEGVMVEVTRAGSGCVAGQQGQGSRDTSAAEMTSNICHVMS